MRLAHRQPSRGESHALFMEAQRETPRATQREGCTCRTTDTAVYPDVSHLCHLCKVIPNPIDQGQGVKVCAGCLRAIDKLRPIGESLAKRRGRG